MPETMQRTTQKKASALEERLAKIKLKQEQLENKKKVLLRSQKEKERKDRTKRLIQNGALAEKYLCCENIDPQEFGAILHDLLSYDSVKDFVAQRKGK